MRKVSTLEAMRAWLSLTTWRERLALALGAVLALALLAGMVAQGENIGAHVWKNGWACGETLKGSPACVPDRRAAR